LKNIPHIFRAILLLAWIASVGVGCMEAFGQRARFEDFFEVQNQPTSPPIPDRGIFNNSPPVQLQPPAEIIGQPEIFYTQPRIDAFQQPVIPNQSTPFPYFPYQSPDPFGSGVQPFQPQPQPYWGTPPSPTYEGTNSNWLPSIDWNRFNQEYLQRFLERPRARQTYIYGRSKENQLGINDVEIATTLAWQNFLQSNQPLRITPGFMVHYWNGPNSIANPGFDLPARAYSILASLDHITNPANQIGLETGFTAGYYSDFRNHSSDGIRLTGRALGWTRLNSYTIAKLGIEYFDRIKVKMLPAFGVYMTPNSDTKIDLYFPKPKLSHRIPNLNDIEAWVYVGGEYGGGSWIIERTAGTDDQVDINDVRAYIGIEWMGPRRVTGFLEAGYVFDREILYRSAPLTRLDIADSFLIRSGFAF
jgi:hypothetical protein